MQSESTPTDNTKPSRQSRDQETTNVSPRPLGSTEQLQKGDLFVSRYEITERINDDGLVRTYSVLDVKTNQSALLSVVLATLLPNTNERMHVVQQLQNCIGQRASSGLIDAGYDGSRVYTVEPHPGGVPLRNVLRARASKAQRYRMQELLSFLTPLEEILDNPNEREPHGGLRADVVWVNVKHTVVTGWNLMKFLPIPRIRRALRQDRALSLMFAPEMGTGSMTKASDFYGVAVIVHEALTGRLPDPDAKPIATLELVGEALSHYLRRDPKKRPESLRPLLQTIREKAAEEQAALDHASVPSDELFSTQTEGAVKMYSEDTFPRQATPTQREFPSILGNDGAVEVASHRKSSLRVWFMTVGIAIGIAAIILAGAYLMTRSILH